MQKISYFVKEEKLPGELKPGIMQIMGEYPLSFKSGTNKEEICFLKNAELAKRGGLEILEKSGKVSVNYGRKIDAFRALGYLFGKNFFTAEYNFSEFPSFDMLGVMLESSRNGVMTVENVKAFLRRCALMGINVVMLYTEDTYEVKGQPFFGYLRGRYTQEELREMDNYAYNLGIEMFPCIQTLGHLQQILQWREFYGDVADTDNILLVGEEKTYKLLEQMISNASAPFRSKRIHVGMDEAHGLGTGEYKKRHGERRVFDIMNEHLARVYQICDELGLKPMMWSDMFFRIGSKTNDYYDLNTEIPEDVIKNIPKNIDLVYWDYYHLDYDFYTKFIDMHRKLGKEPIVAPGAWNWCRFWSALHYAYSTIEPCMHACKDKNVRQVFLTTWGDDGMENDIYSVLPAMQFFAELGYANKIDKELLKANFMGSCGGNIEAYNLASKIDLPPCLENYKYIISNVSKWLLWDDPIIGLCEPLQEGQSFRKHYADLFKELKKNIGRDPYSKRLLFPAQIAKVLSIKCDCRKNLVSAYKNNDKKKISKLLDSEVRPLLREVKKLWQIHRDIWLETYKPFGLEVIEIRYGGLITRLQSLIIRLEQYLKGDIKSIPEFETKLLKFESGSAKQLHHIGSYRRIATPSAIL